MGYLHSSRPRHHIWKRLRRGRVAGNVVVHLFFFIISAVRYCVVTVCKKTKAMIYISMIYVKSLFAGGREEWVGNTVVAPAHGLGRRYSCCVRMHDCLYPTTFRRRKTGMRYCPLEVSESSKLNRSIAIVHLLVDPCFRRGRHRCGRVRDGT